MEKSTIVASGRVKLAVREWPGRGPSLLLIHGLASSSHIFDLVAPLLAGSFRVVAYDQRGHGLSSKPGSGYGYAAVAADALVVIDELRLGRPIVLGHSWGASVALEVAARHPGKVRGAILLDGGYASIRDRMDWATTLQVLEPPPLAGMHVEQFLALLRQMVGSSMPVTPQIEAVALSLMRVDAAGRIRPRLSRRNHLRILRAMWEQDAVALLRTATVPTLALITRPAKPGPGEQEFLDMKREAALVIRSIGSPVSFEWIAGIHDVPLQRPAAVAARVRRFAADLLARGSGSTRRPPTRSSSARRQASTS
jgi:pimeloyl-ACP methyl ester carboxylesterase